MDLTLRPADPADLPVVADLYLRTRVAAVPAMPPVVHPDEEVRAHIGSWRLDERDLWVAEADEAIVGFADVTESWLGGLYVDPSHQREGVGGDLLDLVKALRPDGFGLWVFASNTPARAFYARHGLVERETTDGSGNEERSPDVRLEWPAP